jgi:short subunit dehydrogenase-like uncharacterized protein
VVGEVVVYGASGYSGDLCTRALTRVGLRPVVAGRNAEALRPLAEDLELASRAVQLGEPRALRDLLATATVVLNCAGPFDRTIEPVVEACLDTGTHYLDLAGELSEFQLIERYDARARGVDVLLLPGAGFAVVPTDCLAVHVARRLPTASRLDLAFATSGGVSRGTLTTLLRDLPTRGAQLRGGLLVPARVGEERRTVDFGGGPVPVTTLPWRADGLTAARSTGVATIRTFVAVPGPSRVLLQVGAALGPVLRTAPVRAGLSRLVARAPAGPSPERRACGWSAAWAEAADDAGTSVAARLIGPEAYDLTAFCAVALVRRVLRGPVPVGFTTPAAAFGPDVVLDACGVRREDLPGGLPRPRGPSG